MHLPDMIPFKSLEVFGLEGFFKDRLRKIGPNSGQSLRTPMERRKLYGVEKKYSIVSHRRVIISRKTGTNE